MFLKHFHQNSINPILFVWIKLKCEGVFIVFKIKLFYFQKVIILFIKFCRLNQQCIEHRQNLLRIGKLGVPVYTFLSQLFLNMYIKLNDAGDNTLRDYTKMIWYFRWLNYKIVIVCINYILFHPGLLTWRCVN